MVVENLSVVFVVVADSSRGEATDRVRRAFSDCLFLLYWVLLYEYHDGQKRKSTGGGEC